MTLNGLSPDASGRVTLYLESRDSPLRESNDPEARNLVFGIWDLKFDPATPL